MDCPIILALILFYILCGCQRGLSQACTGCKDDNCYSWGECVDGCKVGRYGTHCTDSCYYTNCFCRSLYGCDACNDGYYSTTTQKCTRPCRINCVSCTEYWQCIDCKSGYYGGYCQHHCDTVCKDKICYKDTGECHACVDGKYGTNCGNDCPINCTSCTGSTSCTQCNIGFYGTTCSLSCSAGCDGNQCELLDGKCNCKTNFKGEQCLLCVPGKHGEHCSLSCSGGCDGNRCEKLDGKCNCKANFRGEKCLLCVPGKHGEQCSEDCPVNCDTCVSISNCTSCKTGFYGENCPKKCSSGCKSGTCSKEEGFCEGGQCKPGYSGPRCCSQGMFGENCDQRCPANCVECSGIDKCSSCNIGYYGETCSKICPSNCLNKECNKDSGLCLHCHDGRYGVVCEYTCPPNCSNGVCHQLGNCQSCLPGSYGNICNQSCPTNCEGSECDQASGHCKTCPYGYYGSTCERECFNCREGTLCDMTSGTCTHGCKDGYSVPTCTEKCSSGCKSCAQSDNTYCYTCISGKYGSQDCSQTCPKGCLNGTCYMSNGRCNRGCIGPFHGSKCDCPYACKRCYNGRCTECKYGYYERDKQCGCSKSYCSDNSCNSFMCLNSTFYVNSVNKYCCQCSSRCKYGECVSGSKCKRGCVEGFYGTDCSGKCSDIEHCIACTESGECKMCSDGFYPTKSGLCIACAASCLHGHCNSSTGYCIDGCTDGYWGPACNNGCKENCILCQQENGQCLSCSNNTWYGEFCELPCSTNCSQNVCRNDTGSCVLGCVSNHYGTSCQNPCPDTCANVDPVEESACSEKSGECLGGCTKGHFGSLCNYICNQQCVNTTCHRATGQCTFGCNTEYEMAGAHCVKALASSDGPLTGAAIGGLVAAVVVIAVIFLLAFILVRRRKHDENKAVNEKDQTSNAYTNVDKTGQPVQVKSSKSSISKRNVTNPNYEMRPLNDKRGYIESCIELDGDGDASVPMVLQTVSEDDGETYYNCPKEVNKAKIPVNELADYVAGKDWSFFGHEFQKLPAGLLKPYVDSQNQGDLSKNRYKGIYPYDDNRVKVPGGDSDYINASYIDGYKKRNAYIASQGPTKKHMGDLGVFWRMIWQQKVEKVVMLTNLIEEMIQKCDQYWPSTASSKVYSDIEVTCLSEDIYAIFTLRTFRLTKGSEQRSLHQLHFTAWPDKGIPDDVTSLIEFRQKVLSLPCVFDGPVLVHCSAGIGRTGTYIALDMLTNEGEAEGSVNIQGCIINMRLNRTNMVQKTEQYAYLHDAVVHSLTFNCKPVPGESFPDYMTDTNVDELGVQFAHLQETVAKRKQEDEAGDKNKNISGKNRTGADIPGDKHRPRLYLGLTPGASDYVNAVFVDSYTSQNCYIVAQSPLPDTVTDFLTLVYQEDCSCIVSFEPDSEIEKSIGAYYPADNQTLEHSPFTVSCVQKDTKEYCTQRNLVFTHQRSGSTNKQEKTITHAQFTNWNEDNKVPNSPSQFLELICEVETIRKQSSGKGPILIHCLDGGSKSGLFCVVSTLLQKMEIEHEVSVVNTVRQVKSRRPQAIPNEDQFRFCYTSVQEYLQSFDIYSNFALN